MADPSEQLQRLYLDGFELQTFDRYPNSIGVLRDGCIALLRAAASGLEIIGTPGWRMGEVMGVLVERDGRQVFQAKTETVSSPISQRSVFFSLVCWMNRSCSGYTLGACCGLLK